MTTLLLSNGLGATGFKAALATLASQGTLLDAVQRLLEEVEGDQSIPYVGLGAEPNFLGELETDAAIMNGDTRETGAVAALKGYLHPIAVARAIMEKLPHVFLAGDGAARFAEEIAATPLPEMPAAAQKKYKQFLKDRIPDYTEGMEHSIPLSSYVWPKKDDDTKKDTVVVLAKASNGQCIAATSTSGWGYKYPGRVGDSPVIGAGLYADSRYGACACTHTGEMSIRASTARCVIFGLSRGASLEEAVHDAMQDTLSLQGGYLGPLVIHALDKDGNIFVLSSGDEKADYVCSVDGIVSSHPATLV